MTTFNSFLASFGAYRGAHIGPFIGQYAYVYLPSGMQIVVFAPGSFNELAMNGS
jgi:hypothetical protein